MGNKQIIENAITEAVTKSFEKGKSVGSFKDEADFQAGYIEGTVTATMIKINSCILGDELSATTDPAPSKIFDAIGAYLTEKGFTGKITRSSDLVRTHGLDSLDMMEFIMVMEDKFDVVIPDVELEKATQEGHRIQTIIDLIESAQNE